MRNRLLAVLTLCGFALYAICAGMSSIAYAQETLKPAAKATKTMKCEKCGKVCVMEEVLCGACETAKKNGQPMPRHIQYCGTFVHVGCEGAEKAGKDANDKAVPAPAPVPVDPDPAGKVIDPPAAKVENTSSVLDDKFKVRITIFSDKKEYTPGEPIMLTLTYKNEVEKAVDPGFIYSSDKELTFQNFGFLKVMGSEKKALESEKVTMIKTNKSHPLDPGKERTVTVDISKYYTFNKAGEYTISLNSIRRDLAASITIKILEPAK